MKWITDSIKSNYLKSLKEILSIPSYIQEDGSPYPFGKPIQDALVHAIKTADQLGFESYIDHDGFYGYAQVGEGKDLIGIIGHLDVVPPGDRSKWRNDPFTPIQENEKLFARGSQDDKGPIYGALFAVKALLDQGTIFKKRVRIIFGTDEESLWRCINKYKEKEEIPSMGFTPDASFPLIYAEKAILQYKITQKNNNNIDIIGGDSINAVCDKALYYSNEQESLIKELQKLNYDYEQKKDHVIVFGKSAHAQSTQKGINAISRLCIALNNIGYKSDLTSFIAEKIGESPYAFDIFGKVQDDISGHLHFNIGKIDTIKNNDIYVDLRVPVVNSDEDDIFKKLSRVVAKYNLSITLYDMLPSIYIDKNHFLVRSLLSSYREVSGDNTSQPIATGGGTYARAIKNCIAFGPFFPNSPGVEHQPNEYIILDDMYRAMEIYSTAIKN